MTSRHVTVGCADRASTTGTRNVTSTRTSSTLMSGRGASCAGTRHAGVAADVIRQLRRVPPSSRQPPRRPPRSETVTVARNEHSSFAFREFVIFLNVSYIGLNIMSEFVIRASLQITATVIASFNRLIKLTLGLRQSFP